MVAGGVYGIKEMFVQMGENRVTSNAGEERERLQIQEKDGVQSPGGGTGVTPYQKRKEG